MPRICYQRVQFKPESLRLIQIADQICSEYADEGYDLTLRQLYYQFVARGIIENSSKSYNRLGDLVDKGRKAGLIDWDHLVDRTRNLSDLAHWDDPAEIVAAAARSFRLAKWDAQPVRVEVWIEKEALAGVVERICHTLDVPFFACRGYVSQSEQWRAAQRLGAALEAGKRVVVLHLGDHDPSGIDMTRDNRERLSNFMLADYTRALLDGYEEAHGCALEPDDDPDGYAEALERCSAFVDRFEVRRIALTMDQVEEYEPPPNPAKLTDSRSDDYCARYGDSSWELDALPPDVLSALIEEHVLDLRDDDLWHEAEREEEEGTAVLEAISERWPEVQEMFG